MSSFALVLLAARTDPAATLVRAAAPGAPPGSRDRHPTREIVSPADVLAEPTETGWDGAGIWLARVVGSEAVRAESGAGQFPDCVMRAQRDAVHPASRRASPARHNPPALDSREPTSHNASPGDITNSTPPGLAPGSSGAGTHRVPGRVPDPPGAETRTSSSRPLMRADAIPPVGGDAQPTHGPGVSGGRNSPSRRGCSEGRTRWAPKHFSPGTPTRKSRAIPVRKAHWVAEIPLGHIP